MDRRCMCALWAALVLVMTFSPVPSPGQTGDIRLSREPLGLVIPEEARIQSAARIGSSTLVVWGTTRNVGDTAAVNTLAVQLLRDTLPSGPRRLLVSPGARPFGFVTVVPLHDRFLVVWNDRRGGDTASFAQRVDTAGEAIGEEEIFASKPIDTFGIIRLERLGGYRLVWNDRDTATARIRWRDIDSNASLLSAVQGPLEGVLQQVSFPALLPGVALLGRGGRDPLIYRPDGVFDTLRGEAAHHLTFPYYLDEDGGLVTLEDGSVRFYRTLLDTVAYRTVTAPKIGGTNAGTWLVTRNQSGELMVVWSSGGGGTYYGVSGGTFINADIFGSVLTPGDTFAQPKRLGAITVGWAPTHYDIISQTFTGSKQFRGCGNQYRVELYFDGVHEIRYGGFDTTTYYKRISSFNVDGVGNVIGDGPYTTGTPLISYCPSAPDIPVKRTASDTSSDVAVTLSPATVGLSAPGAIIPVNMPDRSPAIRRAGNDLITGWLKFGKDSTAQVGMLHGNADGVSYIAGLDLHVPAPDPRPALAVTFNVWSGCNDFLLEQRERWQGSTSTGEKVDSQRVVLYTGSVDGWKRAATMGASDGTRTFMPVSVVHNPDDGSRLVTAARVTHNGWEVAIRALSIDSSGTEAWRVDSLPIDPIPPKMVGVPLGGRDFLGFYTDGVFTFAGDSIVHHTPFSPTETRNYAKLYGGSILRWQYNNGFLLDLLDTEGNRTGPGGIFKVEQAPIGISLALNDRDSSIAFVYGSRKGVRLILFDRDLRMWASDVPVSTTTDSVSNPAAVFRNDTLFVLWEDYRNGLPDIYGTARVVRQLLGVEVPADSRMAPHSLEVVPNPASSSATLYTPGPLPGTLTIVDAYGTVRMQWPVTASRTTVDLRSLPVGMYRVQFCRDGRQISAPLVVVR